jgi:putative ABC transport system substrate-binding protein
MTILQRRDFIAGLGGAAAWPLAASAQQPRVPVVGFVSIRTPEAASVQLAAAFRSGLNEAGYLDGKDVTVEYHWVAGQYASLPSLMADLVSARGRYRHAWERPCLACGQSCDRDHPDHIRRR